MTEEERDARLREILDEVSRRLSLGEEVDPDEVIKAHPDLPELGRQVRALKLAHDVANMSVGTTASLTKLEVPQQIGPYQILETLGEGGFGIVYLAEQSEPVKRRVALKVIKPGMDSRSVIARFETERQALALMDHPNVAKVFDAGTTAEGRPYFVMEYIPGIPITEHCDRNKLGIDERLAFFITVCEAVQHAHQKGVIHRDLKPSNVLIYFQDDKAVPKVIDFGVAKAIDQRLTEKTLFTELGQLVGTPAYMSPEQADLTAQNIDTRSDIYSLGVLLYELLTGSLPIDLRTLRSAAFQEIRRIILEVDPEKPSTRFRSLLTSGGEDSAQASQFALNRRVDPQALSRLLRGDLDWITMRALEKDRSDRYASASEFAADIRNYLSHRPVIAGPPGAVYHFRKFVRRNRGLVATAVVVFLSLTTGLVSTGVTYLRVLKERDRADREAQTSRFVSDFLIGLFDLSDPRESLGRNITVREVLDEGSRQIRLEYDKQPQVQASLMASMGRAYRNLELYDDAKALEETALEIRRRELGEEHLDVAKSLFDLASVYLAKGDTENSRMYQEQALQIRRRLAGADSAEVAESLCYLGETCLRAGQYDEAVGLLQQALRMQRLLATGPSVEVAVTLRRLGHALLRLGRLDEAEPHYRDAIAIFRQAHGADHPDIAVTKHYLAQLLQYKGDLEASLAEYQEVREMYQRYYAGKDHPYMASYLNNYGGVLNQLERFDEAERVLLEALAMDRRLHGDSHPSVAGDLSTLGVVKRNQGDYPEAEAMFRQAIDVRVNALGADNEWVGISRSSLGACLTLMNRYEDAEKELLEAFRIQEARLKTTHPRTKTTIERLIALYEQWQRPDDAERWRQKLAESTNQ